ncbi:MAG: hypothetical protein COB45_12495 [Gammaproteobacteria bacterium]|nr:MAG: hypothetical protein COB45_12495 [Gammaproteobacteria bacterium]PHR84487.1 MAG: hypothetical protein COA59_05905 [Colwellia sp.]
MNSNLLLEDSDEDPFIAVVNLIDVLLVIIAALFLVLADNPLSPFTAEDVTVISNPGTPQMEIVIKKGQEIKRYKSKGASDIGAGVKVGTAYQLPDGSMVYIPE